MKTMYVYILQCADKSYYVGVTNNLERRLKEHESALHPESYTAKRLPVVLMYNKIFNSPLKAITYEKQLKRWSRAKKKALIEDDTEALVALSKKVFRR
jgi:putative endonuclease